MPSLFPGFDTILYVDHVERPVSVRCFTVSFAPDLALHSDSLDVSSIDQECR